MNEERYILEIFRKRSKKSNPEIIYEQLRRSRRQDFWMGDLSINMEDDWAISLPDKIKMALSLYANDCKTSLFGYSNYEHLFHATPDELMQFVDFKTLFDEINKNLEEAHKDGKDVPLRRIVLGRAQFPACAMGKADSNGNEIWNPKYHGNYDEPEIRKMIRQSNLVYVGPEVRTEYFEIMNASVDEMITLIFNTQIEFMIHAENDWSYE